MLRLLFLTNPNWFFLFFLCSFQNRTQDDDRALFACHIAFEAYLFLLGSKLLKFSSFFSFPMLPAPFDKVKIREYLILVYIYLKKMKIFLSGFS